MLFAYAASALGLGCSVRCGLGRNYRSSGGASPRSRANVALRAEPGSLLIALVAIPTFEDLTIMSAGFMAPLSATAAKALLAVKSIWLAAALLRVFCCAIDGARFPRTLSVT